MDEISLFAALRPAPPADAQAIRERVRAKVATAMATSPARPSGRGLAWRGYRSVAALGAAATVVAGAAVVVPSMLPTGNSGSFVTAAWAVERGSDGAITVSLSRTFTHQHQLQTDLRADGVPAYVRSEANCTWLPKGGLKQIVMDERALWYRTIRQGSRFSTAVIIHPNAIPKDDAVFIGGSRTKGSFSIQFFLMPNDGPPVCRRSAIVVKPYVAPIPTVSPTPTGS